MPSTLTFVRDIASCNTDCTPSTGIRKVATGREHTCILTWAGQVKCWGDAMQGQLGYGNIIDIGDNELPSSVGFVDTGGFAIDISAGEFTTCVVHDDHTALCWGLDGSGHLGQGPPGVGRIGDDELPSSFPPIDIGAEALEISAGLVGACVRTTNDKVRCWGASPSGQTGYGSIDTTYVIPGDVDIGADVVVLSVGSVHACVVTVNGTVRCWGSGYSGALGYGNLEHVGDDEVPADVGDVDVGPGNVVQVDAGKYSTCVVFDDGGVKCWGAGNYGILGQPGISENIGDDETPAVLAPIDIGGPAVEVVTAYLHACARMADGALRCWGAETFLGHGPIPGNPFIGDDESPASIGDALIGAGVSSLHTGNNVSVNCVVTDAGGVRCWGYNQYGQAGMGNLSAYGNDPGETPAAYGDLSVF